jgi:hypothetical protein
MLVGFLGLLTDPASARRLAEANVRAVSLDLLRVDRWHPGTASIADSSHWAIMAVCK